MSSWSETFGTNHPSNQSASFQLPTKAGSHRYKLAVLKLFKTQRRAKKYDRKQLQVLLLLLRPAGFSAFFLQKRGLSSAGSFFRFFHLLNLQDKVIQMISGNFPAEASSLFYTRRKDGRRRSGSKWKVTDMSLGAAFSSARARTLCLAAKINTLFAPIKA